MDFGRQDPIKMLKKLFGRKEEDGRMGRSITALRSKIQEKWAADQSPEVELVKEAQYGGVPNYGPIQKDPGLRISDIAKGTAVGMAVGAGIKGIGTMVSRAIDRAYVGLTEGKDKAKNFSKMLQSSPELGKENATKVQRAYNSLYRWNPEMARDPLVAASFVQRSIDYGAVTTEEVERMVKTRMNLGKSREQESLLGGLAPVSGSEEVSRALFNSSIHLDR